MGFDRKTFLALLDELLSVSPVEGQDPVEFLMDPLKLSPAERALFSTNLHEKATDILPKQAIIPSDMSPLDAYRWITGERNKKLFDRQADSTAEILKFFLHAPTSSEVLHSLSATKPIAAIIDHQLSKPRKPSSQHQISFTSNELKTTYNILANIRDDAAILRELDKLKFSHPFYDGCPVPLPSNLLIEPIAWSFETFYASHQDLFSKWQHFLAKCKSVDKVALTNWLCCQIDSYYGIIWPLDAKLRFSNCPDRTFRRYSHLN